MACTFLATSPGISAMAPKPKGLRAASRALAQHASRARRAQSAVALENPAKRNALTPSGHDACS
eukprot:14427667-Alexandrium_andersonii.AAC.1